MKQIIRVLIALVGFVFLFTTGAQLQGGVKFKRAAKQAPAEEEAAGPMTIWQARKAVITGLQSVVLHDIMAAPSGIVIDGQSIQFMVTLKPRGRWDHNYDRVSCFVTGSPCRADLKSIGEFSADPKGWPDKNQNRFGRRFHGLLIDGNVPISDIRTWSGTRNDDQTADIWAIALWSTSEAAESFADAMNRLRATARGEGNNTQTGFWRDFPQKASAWRALSPKPPLPEEVRQRRLIAESALREKNFDTAIETYEEGLTLDPVWPEGHFNAALLCAELRYYAEAIRHMQAYLELLPDAPDAQAARDQIVIWQAKMR